MRSLRRVWSLLPVHTSNCGLRTAPAICWRSDADSPPESWFAPETPVDVEEELARLTAPKIDAGLRAEIRDLVIARNHRRTRAGKPPLDVEAEIEREISKLSNL